MSHHRHFKHLHVPEHWEQYWSKYPNGYTVLEALINWTGQVNDMVDSQNHVSDQMTALQIDYIALEKELRMSWNAHKEHHTKTYSDFTKEIYTIINGWIATIEPTIQDEVVKSMNEWLDDGTLADIINIDVFNMKATIVQYSQLKSISALKDALENKGQFVDIDEDITLNEVITLNQTGIYSSNGSKINLGDNGQIKPIGKFYIHDVDFENISLASTLSMIYLNREGGTHFNNSYIQNVNIEGKTRLRNGIDIISDKEATGVYAIDFNHINFARLNDEIHIEVNNTGDDYGWVNGNRFSFIKGGDSYRGIVSLPINDFARNRNVSNIFTDLQLQTYRTAAVYDLGLNVYDIQPYDFHRVGQQAVTHNKFGKLNGEIHSLAQNSVTIFNPKHSAFTGSDFLETGMFTDLNTANSFVNIHFYTHKGEYKGKVTLSLNTAHATTKTTPVTIKYESAELEKLTILTQYDEINKGIRVFIKSFGDIAYWGTYERKYFMPTYSPLKFTLAEMETIVTQVPVKEVGGFENSKTIYESVVENGQSITRYHDGTQMIYSTIVENKTIPAVAPSTISASQDIQVEFRRPFISKPVVTFNGQPSKVGSPVTGITINNLLVDKSYARGVIKNDFIESIDRIIDFSWSAIGRWK